MTIHYSRILDLSHPIQMHMPCWPGDPPTEIKKWATPAKDGYNMNQLTIAEHAGTHAGAPRHFAESGISADKIPADNLVAPAIMINVQKEAAMNRDFLLSPQDILAVEKEAGVIKDSSIVLVKTGWSDFWPNESKYFAVDRDGMHFPGISPSAARFLVTERHIIALGIDTAGIDGGQSREYTANKILAANNVYHLENLNLSPLLASHLYVFVGILAIADGSGSPCRVLGLY
ncbi:cyclase family protein [candidate division KSB1 bacterium]|nr:cyclase family protein [candidate division KSB1 bacterium]